MIRRIVRLERIQHADLNRRGIPILLHRPNDLDGHLASCESLFGFDDFAKGSLAEETNNAI